MIKTKVINSKTDSGINYPCLMWASSTKDSIFLITNDGSGTCVCTGGNGSNRVGCIRTDLIMSCMTPFDGVLELENN